MLESSGGNTNAGQVEQIALGSLPGESSQFQGERGVCGFPEEFAGYSWNRVTAWAIAPSQCPAAAAARRGRFARSAGDPGRRMRGANVIRRDTTHRGGRASVQIDIAGRLGDRLVLGPLEGVLELPI